MKIVLGAGAKKALVELDEIPEVGQRIQLQPEQIRWGLNDFGRILYDLPITIASRGEDVDIEGSKKVPWFNFRLP